MTRHASAGTGDRRSPIAASRSRGGCARSSRRDGNAIVVGMANSAINLDPRVGTDEASQKVHQLLFNTLLRIDNQLRVVPELAESLEQPDPLTYVAHLRHGVLFHNGRELTRGRRRLHVPELSRSRLPRPDGAPIGMLAAVNALDRYTVEFKLKTAVGSFPINLVMGIVQAGSGAANARAADRHRPVSPRASSSPTTASC